MSTDAFLRKLVAVLTMMFGAAVLPALAQGKLTYNMSWFPQGPSIGPIVAVEKGWFKEAGLEVALVRGYGGTRTANELDQGQFEIGYVDPIVVFLNRVNGGKIRMIGAINTRLPASFCYARNRNKVNALDDLKGLSLGSAAGAPAAELVPAMLEMNGRPRDFVRIVRVDPAVMISAFLEGRVDVADCWAASSREVAIKQARQASVNVGWLDYSDLGVDAYGSGFATRDELIRTRPEALRRFLRAAYRGYEFAIANPQEALKSMQKVFPTIDSEIALAQITAINQLIVDGSARQQGLGHLRPDRMRSTLAFAERAYKAAGKPVTVDDLYTNDLLK